MSIKFSLEDSIKEDLGRQIQESIDDKMSYGFMMKYWQTIGGWTTVKLSKFQDNKHAVDITDWLFDNDLRDTVDYYREGAEFVFASEKIATLFALRWAA